MKRYQPSYKVIHSEGDVNYRGGRIVGIMEEVAGGGWIPYSDHKKVCDRLERIENYLQSAMYEVRDGIFDIKEG